MAEITDRQLNVKPDNKDIWLNESAPKGHGRFIARVTPKGERLFYFRYTDSKGARVRLPIGSYNKDGIKGLTVKDARKKARELSDLYLSGITDLREYLDAKQATITAQYEKELAQLEQEKLEADALATALASRKTIRDLFEHWMKIDIVNRKDSGAEVRRMFEKDVLPFIGNMYIEDIRKSHVIEVTDTLLARKVQRMARVIFSLLRQMFRFALDRDLIDQDPTATIRKARVFGKDNERERVLTEEEIKLLAQALPNAGLLLSTQLAVWVTLGTCCRIGELLTARWQHIDFTKRTWLIPAENSKNAKAHTIYLSDFVLRQFQHLYSVNSQYEWCYPNSKKNDAVCPKTITKQLSDRQRLSKDEILTNRTQKADALLLPNGKWTPHDLRRTGATLMTALGVLPEVAERCLNHIEENKIKRTYQRYSYAKEMQEAWELLSNYLQELTIN